jgi:hypothetical protein
MNTPEQYLYEITNELERRAEWWRTNPKDPHNINTAVYVSLLETSAVIRQSIEGYLPKTGNAAWVAHRPE